MKSINEDLIKRFVAALIEVATDNSQEKSDEKEEKQSNKLEYEVITADEILQMEGDTLPYLVDPLLPRQGLVGFGGSSDTGKSTFLKQLADAIARGKSEFLGFPLSTKHRSVIYVSTEDDIHAVKTVLKKQRKKNSRSSAVKGLRFLFNSELIYRQVKAELEREPADLVIIDAFSDIAPGDLNQSNIVRPFLDKFSNLSKKHECLVIFLHHTKKSTEGKVPKKGNLLGSQGFEAKCRLVALLVKDPHENGIRHFCLVKGNYLSDDFKSQSYVLKFNENLTFDYTGERVDLEVLGESENQLQKKREKEEKKKLVQRLKSEGWKQNAIADEVGVDPATITRWLADMNKGEGKLVKLEDDMAGLKEKLLSFVENSNDFKDLHELRSKYNNASKGLKGSIRSQFRKFLGTKEVVKVAVFAKLLED